MEVLSMRRVKISMLIVATILFSTWFTLAYHASKQDNGLEEKRILRLKYDLFCTLVEYKPGKELEFRNPDATLNVEFINAGDKYILNLTVDIKGYALCIENSSNIYTEFRKCVVFEYNIATKRFYWQGRDVGVLLPLFQPLEDRIILFDAEFIPLGAEPRISSYPPSSPVWASKKFTSRIDLKEGKVYIPELNRTWWLSEAGVRPPIWDALKALSKIAGNDVLEIIHYGNDTVVGLPSAYIERNTGIIIYMRMIGPLRTLENSTVIVNDKPVSKVPILLLPYSLGLRNIVVLELINVEFDFS